MTKRIAVVGGGFCGTMVVYHLLTRKDIGPVEILFFDSTQRHARGVAYGTMMDEHLLNVPAKGMSALPDDPGHFVRWVENGDGAVFYPRRLYGRYLQQFYDLAQAAGQTIIPLGDRIGRIGDSGGGRMMVGEYDVDAVILATGVNAPRWPAGTPANDPRLIDSPYGARFPDDVQRLKTMKNIAVLGTGLSGVDAVMSLYRAGYTGKIHAVSRRGRWPAAHSPRPGRLFDWRRGIDALRPYSNRLWRVMPQDARRFLLRHVGLWNTVRHRMPQPCHAVLRGLKKSGQLQHCRGAVRGIAADNEQVRVVFDGGKTLAVDAVINCLGFVGAGVAHDPLYAGLAQDGVIALRDGIPVPADGFRLSADRALFALGPPLFGHWIESTAVPELRVQAKAVADQVALWLNPAQGTARGGDAGGETRL